MSIAEKRGRGTHTIYTTSTVDRASLTYRESNNLEVFLSMTSSPVYSDQTRKSVLPSYRHSVCVRVFGGGGDVHWANITSATHTCRLLLSPFL